MTQVLPDDVDDSQLQQSCSKVGVQSHLLQRLLGAAIASEVCCTCTAALETRNVFYVNPLFECSEVSVGLPFDWQLGDYQVQCHQHNTRVSCVPSSFSLPVAVGHAV